MRDGGVEMVGAVGVGKFQWAKIKNLQNQTPDANRDGLIWMGELNLLNIASQEVML